MNRRGFLGFLGGLSATMLPFAVKPVAGKALDQVKSRIEECKWYELAGKIGAIQSDKTPQDGAAGFYRYADWFDLRSGILYVNAGDEKKARWVPAGDGPSIATNHPDREEYDHNGNIKVRPQLYF